MKTYLVKHQQTETVCGLLYIMVHESIRQTKTLPKMSHVSEWKNLWHGGSFMCDYDTEAPVTFIVSACFFLLC